jgi:hypothetical protein
MFGRTMGLVGLILFSSCLKKGEEEEKIIKNFDVHKCVAEVESKIRFLWIMKETENWDTFRLNRVSNLRESGTEKSKYYKAFGEILELHGQKVLDTNRVKEALRDLVHELKYLYLGSKRNGLNPHMLRAALLGVKHCVTSQSDESHIWGESFRGLEISQVLALLWEEAKERSEKERESSDWNIKGKFIEALAESQAEKTRDPFSYQYDFEGVTEDTAASWSRFMLHIMGTLP